MVRKDGFLYTENMDCVMNWKKNPTAISLFTGAGGFDIGFSRAGIKTRVMVEFAKECCQTLRANWHWKHIQGTRFYGHPEFKTPEDAEKHLSWYHRPEPVILERDITTLSTEEILEAGKLRVGEATVLMGGPPCQGFSHAGKRDDNDPRNKMIWEFHRVVNETLPHTFVFENVPGITTTKNAKRFMEYTEALAGCGYEVIWDILNAANYGVPQNRKRVFVFGYRIDIAALVENEQGELRMQYHMGYGKGSVRHPDWFIAKHKLRKNNQSSLNNFTAPKDIVEMLNQLSILKSNR